MEVGGEEKAMVEDEANMVEDEARAAGRRSVGESTVTSPAEY